MHNLIQGQIKLEYSGFYFYHFLLLFSTKDGGFYPKEGTPFAEPWDVKEATRAMKDMDIDDWVAQRMRNNFNMGWWWGSSIGIS